MRVANIQTKIRKIEIDLSILKRSISKEPDYLVDQKNWLKVGPQLKKSRKALFQRTYGK